MVVDKKELQTFSKEGLFVSLFSGGKDIAAAMSIAMEYGKPLALIHYIDDNDGYNNALRTDVIRKQALAMDIPLELYRGGRKSIKDLYRLEKILEKYAAQGAKYLVTGSIYDLLAHKINKALTECVGMKLKSPLWGMSEDFIIEKLENKNIQTIITQIDETKLSSDWLGKSYDRNAYNAFKEIGINPFGDEGEFDTTLVDADFMKRKISYKIIQRKEYSLELLFNVE